MRQILPRTGFRLGTKIGLVLWSVFILAVEKLAWFLSLFLQPVFDWFYLRDHDQRSYDQISRKRNYEGIAHSIVFFCSSAGEYEQARPLIDRFRKDRSVYILVIFFSHSGRRYAESLGDDIPFLMAPVDSIWYWRPILAAARPDVIIVVRHELWPAFLSESARWGHLLLIDGTENQSLRRPGPARWLKGRLLRIFFRIYVADTRDGQFFREILSVPDTKIGVIGDTKYDRVLERAGATTHRADRLAQILGKGEDRRLRLVLGSAWEKDVALVLSAYQRLQAAGYDSQWQIVIATHDVGQEMLGRVQRACAGHGLDQVFFSEVEQTGSRQSVPVLIVDRIGILSEIYASADLVFVGGAMHHEVHNVLEPACRGPAVAFGPLYKNSREAILMVEAGLATVVADVEQMVEWWKRAGQDPGSQRVKMLSWVQSLTGASDAIYSEVRGTFFNKLN